MSSDTPAASRIDRLLQLLENGGTAQGVRLTAAKQVAGYVEGVCMAEGGGETAVTPIVNRLVKMVLVSKIWDVRVATASAIERSLQSIIRHQHVPFKPCRDDDLSSSILFLEEFNLADWAQQHEPLVASSGAEFELDLSAMTAAERLKQQKTQLKKTLEFMEGIGDLTNELIEDKDLLDNESEAEVSKSGTRNVEQRELSARERAMLRRKSSKSSTATTTAQKQSAKLEIPADDEHLTELIREDLQIRTILALRANILNATWTVRHGALLSLKEIITTSSRALPAIVNAILIRDAVALLALDRFNDFVSDQTVAPIRETAAQLLATLFTKIGKEIKLLIWKFALQLCSNGGNGEYHWQIRHGGLLCIKYLSAVDQRTILDDGQTFSRLYQLACHGCDELEDEDVKCLCAELLGRLLTINPKGVNQSIVMKLTMGLLRDSESSALVHGLALLDQTISHCAAAGMPIAQEDTIFLLAQRMRHPMSSVRLKSLEILDKMINAAELNPSHLIILLRMLVQNIILDDEEIVWERSEAIAKKLFDMIEGPSQELLAAYVALCSTILTPRGRPFEQRHFIFIESTDPLRTSTVPAAHEIGFRIADMMLLGEGDDKLASSRRVATRIVGDIGRRWYEEKVQRRVAQALVTSDDVMIKYLGICLFDQDVPVLDTVNGESLCGESQCGESRCGESRCGESRCGESLWDLRLSFVEHIATEGSNKELLQKYLTVEQAKPLCYDLAAFIRDHYKWGSTESSALLAPLLVKETRLIALYTLSIAFAAASSGEDIVNQPIIIQLAWALIRATTTTGISDDQRGDLINADLLEKALEMDEEKDWDHGLAQDLFICLAKKHAAWIMETFVAKLLPKLHGNATRTKRRMMQVLCLIFEEASDTMADFASLFIIPVLGKIADSDVQTREAASLLFGDLLRLVPLSIKTAADADSSATHLVEIARKEANEFLALFMSESGADHVMGSQKRALAMPLYRIPVEVKADLRPYQQAGVNWLAFLCKYGLNGALCDDMGLGKTLQSIVILASNQEERNRKSVDHEGSNQEYHSPSLVVCPASLVGHWKHEIETFAPSLGVPLLYAGTSAERRALWPAHRQATIVITSYETVRSDIASLGTVQWDFVVLDEGHVIKNPKTKLTQAVKSLRAEHRLLLSGTPIQNNVIELWSLFDFLMPGMLGTTEAQFMDRYGRSIMAVQPKMTGSTATGGGVKEFEEAERKLKALHRQVLPFILRRMKEDVLTELPPKIIQDYECDPSPIQRLLCSDIERQIDPEADGGEGQSQQKHVFQALQYLRKVCVHPRLVLADASAQMKERIDATLKEMGVESIDDLAVAPKLALLRELLIECGIGSNDGAYNDDLDGGSPSHRVLLFAQHKGTLDLIEELVLRPHFKSTRFLRLDGTIEQRDRFGVAQQFNSDSSFELLLLTTSVGGLGLNLTGADTVIFVEHDWNPMKDLQAMDRAHRLGQRRVVTVYRLIVRDTLEQQIMGLQRWKTRVAATIVQQQNLQGVDKEKLASTGLLDLLGADTREGGEAREPGAKKTKLSADDSKMSRILAKYGVPPPLDDNGEAGEAALSEYSKAFDINSFLKSVNE